MKIEHRSRGVELSSFDSLADLTNITQIIRDASSADNARILPSKKVAVLIAEHFSNLEAIPVSILIYRGQFETTHWVNVTSNGEYIIDTTGDRFDYTNFSKYRHEVVPWLYHKYRDNIYFSSHHMPVQRLEDLEAVPSDIEVLMQTRSPFHRGLRCIYL